MDFFDILLASKLNRSGGGAVNSVNGQTGTVELTAEDVGALSAETLKPAVNLALAQAKASGEFDGADGLTPTIGENGNWYLGDTDTGKPSRGDRGAGGKSAYQYAVDGGYTGTETEFAAKLAQEKFASPNALTFTGAVEGSYDGSAPVTVEIPGGSGASGGSSQWKIIRDLTITENADRVDINKDNDGNTFALHEIHVFSYTQSYADSSEAYTFLLNGFWNAGDPYFSSGIKSTASSSDYFAENHFIATMQNGFANIFQPWKVGVIGMKQGGDIYSFGDKYQTIESVSFVGKFIAGCRFILVGRVTL